MKKPLVLAALLGSLSLAASATDDSGSSATRAPDAKGRRVQQFRPAERGQRAVRDHLLTRVSPPRPSRVAVVPKNVTARFESRTRRTKPPRLVGVLTSVVAEEEVRRALHASVL